MTSTQQTSTQHRGRGDSASSSEERAKSIFGMYGFTSTNRASEDAETSYTYGRPVSGSASGSGVHADLNGQPLRGRERGSRMERVEELSIPTTWTEEPEPVFPSPLTSDLHRVTSSTSSRSRRRARVLNGRLSQVIPDDRSDHTAQPIPTDIARVPPLPLMNDSGEHIANGYRIRPGTKDGGPDNYEAYGGTSNHESEAQPLPTAHDDSEPIRQLTPRPSPMLAAAALEHGSSHQARRHDQEAKIDEERSGQPGDHDPPDPGAMSLTRGRELTAGESLASQRTQQGPEEEDDAFHVRSTYARLEVQGVYGDGWTEGVERTRERAAIANKGRRSLVPGSREDPIADEELRVLSTVDRYGFFDQTAKTRSEHRLVLLTSASFARYPKLPAQPPKRARTVMNNGNGLIPNQHRNGGGSRIGSEKRQRVPNITVPPDMLVKLSARAIGRFREKEDERVGKWARMLDVAEKDRGGNVLRWTWDGSGKGRKVMERVYKGVPDRWRGAAWWAMMEDRVRLERRDRSHPTVENLLRSYETSMDTPSTYDVQIDLDVPRTISGHVLFHTRYGYGQRSLFHVLHCFSMYCATCGYCQGMGPIAATLLTYYDAGRTYAALVRLHDLFGMHSIFEPGFPGLLECFYVQERLLEYLMPEVFTAFERNMISTSSYATKWYITLFANTVPYQSQLRLWDALFLEGPDLLVAVAISIIWSLKDSLSAPDADFEMLLSNLSAFYVPEEEDAFLLWSSKLLAQASVRVKIAGWRRDWARLLADGHAGKALM